MAGRLTFHYYPGDSALHNWDTRCKFFGLLFLAIGLLRMDAGGLGLFSALLTWALASARIPLPALLREMKGWSLFLLLIFIFQAASVPGSGPVFTGPWALKDFWGPVRPALLTVWRLGLLLGYAMVFSMVTRPREIRDAVLWLFRPFPFLPSRRIAFMVSLMVRFLPIILDESEEVRLANLARCANLRKNPLLRIKYRVLPLLRRSLSRADDLAHAIAARGYREDLPVRVSRLPLVHAAFLVPLALLIALGAGWVPGLGIFGALAGK